MAASANPDDIDLAAVLRAVVRRLPVLIGIALLVGAATAGVLSTAAPKYLSQAQLKIRGFGAGEASRPDKEEVGTHVRDLMSTELALQMSKTLKLTEMPEFNSALEPEDLFGRSLRRIGFGGPKASETDEDRLMQAYYKAVRAYQVRETRSVIVDCTSSNAKFSADCANTLAELYRDSLSGRARVENDDVRSKLAPQVERLTSEVAQAESLVTQFRGQANLFQGGSQATQLKEQQLGELTAELTRVATARGEAEARATAAREMGQRGMATANLDVQKSALVPRLEEQRVTLERQNSELSATLLPGHPRMKQLHSELAGLQSQIRSEVQKVVESLSSDARIVAEREAGIRRRIDEMKRTVVSSAPDSAKLAQLDNQAKSKRTELERLQRQLEVAASTAGSGAGPTEVEIVSRAYPSNEKVFPKTGSMASLATLASLIFGLALSLTRELMRGARSGMVAAKQVAAQRPSAAHQAIVPVETARRDAATSVAAMAAAVDASLITVEQAAVALLSTASGASGVRVMVAAPTEQIDAASPAVRVARALAQSGKRVVLVSWEGSGNVLATATGVASAPGVTQLLSGNASLEEATQTLAGTSVDVIVAGEGSGELIDGDRAAMVLDALDENYDFVVVHGTTKVATELFAALQGRFDCGVLVSDVAPPAQDGSIPFLGFDVADFMVMPIAAETTAASGARRNLAMNTTSARRGAVATVGG